MVPGDSSESEKSKAGKNHPSGSSKSSLPSGTRNMRVMASLGPANRERYELEGAAGAQGGESKQNPSPCSCCTALNEVQCGGAELCNRGDISCR